MTGTIPNKNLHHHPRTTTGGNPVTRMLILLCLLLSCSFIQAQVSQYVFSSGVPGYQPGVPATPVPAAVFPAGWDDQTTTYPIPFSFYYNGTTYTNAGTIGVHADGWIAFSTGSISMTGTGAGGSWVSKANPAGVYLNGSANNQGVAVCNADLREQAFTAISGAISSGSHFITAVSSFTDIRIGTRLSGVGIPDGAVVVSFDELSGIINMSDVASATLVTAITPRSSIFAFTRGTAPNREFVIQWTQVRRYNAVSAENISVQCILHEAAGIAANQEIEVIFGDCSSSISTVLPIQVGLRGASAADFNARTTSSDWSASGTAATNTDACSFSQAVLPVSGLAYSWVPCTSVPASAGTLFGASAVCAGSSNTYTLAPVSGAISYAWSYSGTGASFSAVTSVPSNTITFSTGATAGTLTVTPVNVCGNGTSTSLGVTVNGLPTASITYGSSLFCTSTGGQVNVSISGTGGGSFVSSPAGLSLNGTTGAITPSSSTPGSYIVTYIFSNGTCSNTSTAPVTISAPLSGSYTVGSGGNFTSLSAAVAAYNSNCINGPVTFLLTDATYNLAGPLVFAKNSFASPANTLTIRPSAGVSASITGSVNDSALIRILGDYITIDGSNNGTTGRNLTIFNNGSVKPRVIFFGSTGSTPVTNDAVRNCILQAGTTDASVILCSDLATPGNAGYFNNITIQNNSLRNSLYGIFAVAVNSGANGNGFSIVSNDINNTGAMAITFTGIYVEGANGVTISKNNIGNFRGSDDATDNGIWIGPNVRNLQITSNLISNLNYTGTNSQGAHGIYISSGVSNANILVANNMISNLSGDGANAFDGTVGFNNPIGILLSSSVTQSGIKIYNNSIYLGGVSGFTNTLNKANAASSCIRFRADSYADIQNNILVNNLGRSASLGFGAFIIWSSLSQASLFTALDYNIYSVGGITNGGVAAVAYTFANSTQYTTLASWRTFTGKDANSLSAVPVFISGSDLHLNTSSNTSIHNKGKYLAEVTADIDGETRGTLTPDIGCDEFVPSNTAIWVGKVSSDWTLPANWEANTVPTLNTDVTINGGYSFMPAISGTQAVRGLAMLSPGTPPVLTVTGTLQVYGDMSYAGGARISASGGTLEMNGSSVQTIPAGMLQGNALLNLVIGNNSAAGVTLGGTLDIYRSVSFSATGNRLNTGDFLVFKSTATGTSWLGNVTGKTINGQATVERYIPSGITHGKSWQLLAVPVSGSQTVNQAWQEGNSPMSNALNPGYGTIISGNIPNATSLGFDAATPASSGPGMKVYNPLTNGWDGIANTNTLPIENKKGYMVFVRGDRSVVSASAASTPTILRAKGRLYTATAGELPPSSTVAANSFESVGNPYASAIDFTQISKPGPAFVDNTFYVWDPLLPGSQNLGGFQAISSTNGFKPVPGGTANYPSDSMITTIQSGQAFFIHATGAGSGGTISFTEAAKKQGSTTVFRGQSSQPSMRSVLLASGRLADANLAVFHETYSNAYTSDDVIKMPNTGENLGILLDGRTMAIEAREPLRNLDTIRFRMSNLRRQDYSFVFVPNDLPVSLYSAWLVDRYLGAERPVSLSDSTTVSFSVTTDALSAAEDRFMLVFRQQVVLPVNITGISANRNRDMSANVQWTVDNETDIREYIIERSLDGRHFERIGSKLAAGAPSYSWLDEQAPKTVAYYRIQAIGMGQYNKYSSVARINAVLLQELASVYPNPVTDQQIKLYFSDLAKGTCQAVLYGVSGQLLYMAELAIPSQGQPLIIQTGSGLPSGIYQLVVSVPEGQRQVISVQVK